MSDDPYDDLEISELHHEIIWRRSRGEQPKDIAAILFPDKTRAAGVQQVFRFVRETVDAFHLSIESTIRERFLITAERLETLYSICQIQINKMLAASEYSESVIRSCLLILDKQSKLYGFDRSNADPGKNKWIEDAGSTELKQLAKDYGITIPDGSKFS